MEFTTALVRISKHGSIRMEQRGIKRDMVSLVVTKGQLIRKQGLRFYYVTKSDASAWCKQEKEGVRDLVVITDR